MRVAAVADRREDLGPTMAQQTLVLSINNASPASRLAPKRALGASPYPSTLTAVCLSDFTSDVGAYIVINLNVRVGGKVEMSRSSPIRFICGAPFEEALASARGTTSSLVPTLLGVALDPRRRESGLQFLHVAQCLTQSLVLNNGRVLHPLVLVEGRVGQGT